MIALLLVLLFSLPSQCYAGWVYYDPTEYSSASFGGWSTVDGVWHNVVLPADSGRGYLISRGSAQPLDTVSQSQYPPLLASQVIQSVNMGLTWDPYSSDPLNPINAPTVARRVIAYSSAFLGLSLLGFGIGASFASLLGLIRKNVRS